MTKSSDVETVESGHNFTTTIQVNNPWSCPLVLSNVTDDINTTNIPGLLTFSGDNATVNATMPFSVVIGGTSYSLITISTNGWIELEMK